VAFAVGAALLLLGTAASARMPREAPRQTPVRVPADPEGSEEPTRVD